jgi:hypothetical protein
LSFAGAEIITFLGTAICDMVHSFFCSGISTCSFHYILSAATVPRDILCLRLTVNRDLFVVDGYTILISSQFFGNLPNVVSYFNMYTM